MITALINGVEERFTEKMTLKEYLTNRGYDINSVIVEFNFNILKSELWDSMGINDKDNIEILSFVGGG
jgi:sulfur carrier protein